MAERKLRIAPTGEQVRRAKALQKRADDLKAAWDEAVLLRNQYFYRLGSHDEPPVSVSSMARSLGITTNHVARLFGGSTLSNEERDAAAELRDDDPRLP